MVTLSQYFINRVWICCLALMATLDAMTTDIVSPCGTSPDLTSLPVTQVSSFLYQQTIQHNRTDSNR